MKSPLPPPVRVEAAPPEGPLAQGEFWHDAEKEVQMLHFYLLATLAATAAAVANHRYHLLHLLLMLLLLI